MHNPLANHGDAPAQDMKLFQQHCAMCHGATGGGSKVAPPLNSSDMKAATAGEIFWVISNGVVLYGMPACSKLTETQRWEIVASLESLNRLQGASPGVLRRADGNPPFHCARRRCPGAGGGAPLLDNWCRVTTYGGVWPAKIHQLGRCYVHRVPGAKRYRDALPPQGGGGDGSN